MFMYIQTIHITYSSTIIIVYLWGFDWIVVVFFTLGDFSSRSLEGFCSSRLCTVVVLMRLIYSSIQEIGNIYIFKKNIYMTIVSSVPLRYKAFELFRGGFGMDPFID